MAKLENVKAVKQLLEGSHKWQTKKTIGFTDAGSTATRNKRRAVGERWTETNKAGIETIWEQREGYRVKIGKLEEARAAIKEMAMPANCPKCTQAMTKRLDKKMWSFHRLCFDCVIDMEHQHRINGTFDEYAKDLMRRNAEAWFKDADKEVEQLREIFSKETLEFVNGDGQLEKWSQSDRDQFLKKIDEDYVKFKEETLKSLSNVTKES